MLSCYNSRAKLIETGSHKSSIVFASCPHPSNINSNFQEIFKLIKGFFFFLKENVREQPHECGVGKDFLNRTQKELIIKGKKIYFF